MQFANEGAEKKKQEEEVAARKRKVEDREKWEGESGSQQPHTRTPPNSTSVLQVRGLAPCLHLPISYSLVQMKSVLTCTERREERIDSWRAYSKKATKKKKKNDHVLG